MGLDFSNQVSPKRKKIENRGDLGDTQNKRLALCPRPPGPPPEKMGLGWVAGGSNTTEPEDMGQEP